MTQTIGELANKPKTIFGVSKGEQEFVFMRDFYNLLDILQKTALTTSWLAIEEDHKDKQDELDKANKYLTKVGAVGKSIFALGSSKRPEACHALRDLMVEAEADPIKAKCFGTYAVAFLQATLSMPLLIPEFGKALSDNLDDDVRMHSMLLTGLEQLGDDDRRKMVSALTACGVFSSSFNVTAIKRTLPADVKKLMEDLDGKKDEPSV